MRISVNLATRPFVELRPLFAKLRLLAIGLALLAVVLGLTLRSLNAKARTAEAQMNALKATTLSYQQERQRNEARMRQPQNMAVLERSQFLNTLFAAKSFSWTAVMMDLEHVLPAGVQVTSIEPATSKTGEVSIRLRVSGDRDRTVELVRNLEHSQRFINPRLTGEQIQAAQESNGRASFQPAAPGGVEFEILSGYNPLPPAVPKAAKDDSAKTDTAADGAEAPSGPATVSRRARSAKVVPPRQRHLIGGAK
jgi:type IV pilus assembly protein PilN